MVVATQAGWSTVLAGMMLAGMAQAQQPVPQGAPEPPVGTQAGEPEPASDAQPAPTDVIEVPAQGNVTTLGEVKAIKPEDDQPLDLYRFKNPVQAQPNRFSKNWSEPPTPEQVGMSGGYLMMGIGYGLLKAAQGLNKITGGPDQIQSAIARPPPELTPEEQQRAAAICAQQGCDQTGNSR